MSDIEATVAWARSDAGIHAVAVGCVCTPCKRRAWLEAWALVGWLASTDILQQTFQGAMTHTIAALMNFKNAVDALHSRQDNMRVDLAKLQQRLK